MKSLASNLETKSPVLSVMLCVCLGRACLATFTGRRVKEVMKSSVYVLKGCAGSQKWVEVDTFDTMPEARRAAREANEHNADGLGLTMRDYRKRSEGGEGWHVAGKAGDQ